MIQRTVLITILLFCSYVLFSQPNCNIYKYEKNEPCYKGCLESLEAIKHPQGSKQSQLHFDKALELCPTLAYAYREKAVPYLKRGDFINWKKMIDLAVKYQPEQYLSIRGWCLYKFLRDYEGAIADIEALDKMVDYDMGSSGDGDYHLNIVKALCYKGLGKKEQAVAVIKEQFAEKDYDPGLYDFLHLGVLQFEFGKYEEAIKSFNKQIERNNYLAETYYYLGITYKALSDNDNYIKNMNLAKEYYMKGKYRRDTYTVSMDKIFLSDIEAEISNQ